ncbi:MAG TPA: methylmalonyl Co-A mutase-associated GTPase MeaB [Anaerolineales bacterium]|nr:methylmalonyl Co-A mutase-associated GTPase MeaB [Anaerolineales bacterium]
MTIDIPSVLDGNRLALSRVLSQIENDTPAGQQALAELFTHTGNAHLIGVTGAPGTGKSSLVNQIAAHYRHSPEDGSPKKVAIVAVDPSSPFSGGAVLGDRIRMKDLTGDPGVFIRSMASRGSLGGLAKTTAGLVQAFDAAGFEIILIETVGAGQAEVEIARLAHTTLVIEAPGLGDDIQAIKAGILEIADILVVNKADRPGIDQTERALKNMLQLAHPGRRVFQHYGKPIKQNNYEDEPVWLPPIQRTIATEGKGVPELIGLIANHKAHLTNTGDLARRERARLTAELDLRIEEALVARWQDSLSDGKYSQILAQVIAREISPQQAVQKLLGLEEE